MAYSKVDVRAFKIFHPWYHIPKIQTTFLTKGNI